MLPCHPFPKSPKSQLITGGGSNSASFGIMSSLLSRCKSRVKSRGHSTAESQSCFWDSKPGSTCSEPAQVTGKVSDFGNRRDNTSFVWKVIHKNRSHFLPYKQCKKDGEWAEIPSTRQKQRLREICFFLSLILFPPQEILSWTTSLPHPRDKHESCQVKQTQMDRHKHGKLLQCHLHLSLGHDLRRATDTDGHHFEAGLSTSQGPKLWHRLSPANKNLSSSVWFRRTFITPEIL